MIILNTLFPIFALLCLGRILKQSGFTSDLFLKTADRLVYYIFFPVMLFWKVGSSSGNTTSALGLCAAGFAGVGLVCLLSLLYIRKAPVRDYQAGSFAQSAFRFNTYIGMAIILGVLGEEGVRYFGILIGVLIPSINVAAVSILIWHSGEKMAPARKLRIFSRALVSNPLILGCAGGILVSRSGLVFPAFMANTFALMSSVTLPLALISIGGTLSFNGVATHWRTALAAAALKLLVLPAVGWLCLMLMGVDGVPFKVGMIFFTLPTSTALYVLSAQMNSDVELASVAIMLSTLLSFGSLSVALMI